MKFFDIWANFNWWSDIWYIEQERSHCSSIDGARFECWNRTHPNLRQSIELPVCWWIPSPRECPSQTVSQFLSPTSSAISWDRLITPCMVEVNWQHKLESRSSLMAFNYAEPLLLLSWANWIDSHVSLIHLDLFLYLFPSRLRHVFSTATKLCICWSSLLIAPATPAQDKICNGHSFNDFEWTQWIGTCLKWSDLLKLIWFRMMDHLGNSWSIIISEIRFLFRF